MADLKHDPKTKIKKWIINDQKWNWKKLIGANFVSRLHLWKNEFQNYSCFLLDDVLKWKCYLFPFGIENQIVNY